MLNKKKKDYNTLIYAIHCYKLQQEHYDPRPSEIILFNETENITLYKKENNCCLKYFFQL